VMVPSVLSFRNYSPETDKVHSVWIRRYVVPLTFCFPVDAHRFFVVPLAVPSSVDRIKSEAVILLIIVVNDLNVRSHMGGD